MNKKMNWASHYIENSKHEDCKKLGNGIYSVYLWQEDSTQTVFYVGSGKCYRFNDTNPKSRSKEFMNHIYSCKCSPKILAYGIETREDAFAIEQKLIDEYWRRGCPLVNKQGISERESKYRRIGVDKFQEKQKERQRLLVKI